MTDISLNILRKLKNPLNLRNGSVMIKNALFYNITQRWGKNEK